MLAEFNLKESRLFRKGDEAADQRESTPINENQIICFNRR